MLVPSLTSAYGEGLGTADNVTVRGCSKAVLHCPGPLNPYGGRSQTRHFPAWHGARARVWRPVHAGLWLGLRLSVWLAGPACYSGGPLYGPLLCQHFAVTALLPLV